MLQHQAPCGAGGHVGRDARQPGLDLPDRAVERSARVDPVRLERERFAQLAPAGRQQAGTHPAQQAVAVSRMPVSMAGSAGAGRSASSLKRAKGR